MITFKVDGMTCAHCVASVGKAIRGVDPGAEVSVDLAKGTVGVTGAAPPEKLATAIRAAGYAVADGATHKTGA